MSIKKLLYSKNSSLLISILFGIGIISFIYACSGDDCICMQVQRNRNWIKHLE